MSSSSQQAPDTIGERPRTYFRIFLAVSAVAVYSLFLGPWLLQPALPSTVYAVVGFAVYWLIALGVLFFTWRKANGSLKAIGFRAITWKSAVAAVGVGVILSLLVPVLTLLAAQLIPSSASGGIIGTAAEHPSWVILLSVLTAGVTEEIIFRGHLIERLVDVTNRPWSAALISVCAFTLPHLAGWNLTHVVGVVVPLGAVLTAIYMWKRNVLFVMIVHIVIDAPLIFISLSA